VLKREWGRFKKKPKYLNLLSILIIMRDTATVEDLSFSEFLTSLDSSTDPEGFERLEQLSSEYESIPFADRQALVGVAGKYSLSHIANMLEVYEPRVKFFQNFWRAQHNSPNDRTILKTASEAGLTPANPSWYDREQIVPRRHPLLLEEGPVKERFFDETQRSYPQKGYKIPTSMVVLFNGASVNLGVKSDEQFTSHVWTQDGHHVKGDGWHISDYVPVVLGKEVEIFHKGTLHALRARALVDLLTRFPHAFKKSLEDCVGLAVANPEALESDTIPDFSIPMSLNYEEGYKSIERTDPRVREFVLGIPSGLEQSLRKLKDAGYFFEPSEIRDAYQALVIPMPKNVASLVVQEETAYERATKGIETNQTAVQEAILCRGWGRDMLDFFYMLVSPDDTKALVHVIPGESYDDTGEGYFLIGRNGEAEITLSFARNSHLSNENRRSPIQRVRLLRSLLSGRASPQSDDSRKFSPYYHPNWVGAISVETDTANYLSEQSQGPLTARFRNAFCIATPVGQWGEGGDFSLCQDKKYSQLFAEMAKYVSESMSMTHFMHTPIG
jgi:hypothetical protein